jgi:hypothetical protein
MNVKFCFGSFILWTKHMFMYLVTRHGVGLVIGFIEILQIVTTSSYNAVANSRNLQLTQSAKS